MQVAPLATVASGAACQKIAWRGGHRAECRRLDRTAKTPSVAQPTIHPVPLSDYNSDDDHIPSLSDSDSDD
jgi:hypothetical protein